MRGLRGKRVWISGGSGALGQQMVETFLAVGCHVVASARRRTRLMDLQARLHNHERFLIAECDGADPEGTEALLDGLCRESPIDIAVQCAGAFHYGPLEDTDDATVRRAVDSNLLASIWLLRGCLRRMRSAGRGDIVLTAADRVGSPEANFGVYGATKAAVAHLAEAAHREAEGSGVHIHCILPGTLDTPENRAAGMDPGSTPMLPLSRVCEEVVHLLTSPVEAARSPLVSLPHPVP